MNEKKKVFYHEVNWTPERIRRFWDFYVSNTASSRTYFSAQFGDAIIRLAKRFAALSEPIVDMGCGSGGLIGYLLKYGWHCKGVDSSQQSIERVLSRYSSFRPFFLGAVQGTLDAMPLQAGEVGTMFMIEVLEHLDNNYMKNVLSECRRTIKKNGYLIITVPNNENLDAKKIACPQCGCIFHRVQHMESFTQNSLCELLDRHSFSPIFAKALNFQDYTGRGLRKALGVSRRTFGFLLKRSYPHLMVIGKNR